MNQQVVFPVDAARRQPKTAHGTAPQIQTMDPNNIRIMYKADFDYFCCSQCLYEGCNFCNVPERKYMHVLENGYEFSIPISLMCGCCVIDTAHKFFFDRGVYSQQSCGWKWGCLKGDPSLYSNYSRLVCCFTDCPDGMNQCLNGYFPSMCGDRVMVLTSETVCCCLPTRSCWLYNCCGICGIKSGDPMPAYSFPLVVSLIPGTGVELAANMDNSRNMWKQRLAMGGMGVALPAAVPMNGVQMMPK